MSKLRGRVLEVLHQRPGLTSDQLVELTHTSRKALAGVLGELKSEGLVRGQTMKPECKPGMVFVVWHPVKQLKLFDNRP